MRSGDFLAQTESGGGVAGAGRAALPGPQGVWVGAGVVMTALGAALLIATRSRGRRLRLAQAAAPPPEKHRFSLATRFVVGLALLGVGYHLVAHALDLRHFRAPLVPVVVVALAAAALSALVDGLDRSAEGEGDPPGEGE